MSPTTPTIVIQGLFGDGVPKITRLPVGSWPGQYLSANVYASR